MSCGVIVTEVTIDPVAAMKAIEEAFPTATGSRVGPDDFEPIKVLGDGCFGKVMLVRRKGTKDVYAMKSIHKDHVIKNKKVRHTKTERNVMTQLRHPFMVHELVVVHALLAQPKVCETQVSVGPNQNVFRFQIP